MPSRSEKTWPGLSPTYSLAFVCRVSGLPVTAVHALGSNDLQDAVDALLNAEIELLRSRDALSASLYGAVSAARDRATRKTLIEIRRALYNLRRPPARHLEASALTAAAGEIMAAIRAADSTLQLREQIIDQARRYHARALEDSRRKLKLAIADVDFQNGVVISSESLFANLPRYRDASPEVSGSRAEQIERGLLRYFTRMATKATPFGTFCAVIGGEFVTYESAPGSRIEFIGSPRMKQGRVRVNKRIYAKLWDRLLRLPKVRDQLYVEPNPTLAEEDDRLVFLTATDGREHFRRLPKTEVLGVVLDVVRSGRATTMSELVMGLATDSRCDTTEREAHAFVDRLVDIGLLRFRAVVAEQEPEWIAPLLAFLSGIDDPEVGECRRLLVDLDRMMTRFAIGSPTDRATVLRELRSRLRDGADAPRQTSDTSRNPPLYEDATAEATLRVAITPDLRAALDRLAEWVAMTLPMASPRREMASMRHFFDTHYGASRHCESVPLLRFYEDFYREHFKAHLERVHALKVGALPGEYNVQNPFDLPIIRQLRAAEESLAERVRDEWEANPAATELTVTRGMVESALNAVSGCNDVTGRSVNIFAQIIIDPSAGTRVVVQRGHYFAGFGKYFSRFLYLLPERWRTAAFRANSLAANGTVAEICGDAAFNANLHPPLVPWEISYPTGHQTGTARQILCSDLLVSPDPDDADALLLQHGPDGHRVWPVDLGFLNPTMRPALYQLLSQFAPGGFFSFPLPASPRRETGGSSQGAGSAVPIIHRPRITYERAVVLARESWTIPRDQYPQQTSGESDADYFLRVARWRREHGLPQRAYVRVRSVTMPSGAAGRPTPHATAAGDASVGSNELPVGPDAGVESFQPELDPLATERGDHAGPIGPTPAARAEPAARRLSRDFHKPQFIDFSSPILVKLFARLPGNLENFAVVLEECLPTSEQLPTSEGEPYAVELILQLDYRKSGGAEGCEFA